MQGGDEKKMRTWLGTGFQYSRQAPGDLGQSMQTAFLNAFRKREPSGHTPGHGHSGTGRRTPERRGLRRWKKTTWSWGPAPTEGTIWWAYAGTRTIFKGISWGQPTVLEQTLALARKEGLSIHTLEPLTDIDTERDLDLLPASKIWKKPYVSVIIPTLNEQQDIKKAIASAVDADAEILVVDGGSRDRDRGDCQKSGGRRGNRRERKSGTAEHGGIPCLRTRSPVSSCGYPTPRRLSSPHFQCLHGSPDGPRRVPIQNGPPHTDDEMDHLGDKFPGAPSEDALRRPGPFRPKKHL